MKNPVIYRRRGWKDKTLEGTKPKDGLVDLHDEAGNVVVSGLPFFEDPAAVEAGDLPDSYGTGVTGSKSSTPPTVDEGKAAAVVAKIEAAADSDPFEEKDLNRVNVPTLQAIITSLGIAGIADDAKADDLRQAIVDHATGAKSEGEDLDPAQL